MNAQNSPLRNWKYIETSSGWVLHEQYRDFNRLRVLRFLEIVISFFGLLFLISILGLFMFGIIQTNFAERTLTWLLLLGFLVVCLYCLRIFFFYFMNLSHQPLVKMIRCNLNKHSLELEGFQQFWSIRSTMLKTIPLHEILRISVRQDFGDLCSLRLELLSGKRALLSEVLFKAEATFIKELIERDL
jgi:hypothetical protein